MTTPILDKWVCRCLAGEGGYSSAAGLPGVSFNDGRWYTRRHHYVDNEGGQGAGGFLDSYDSFEACVLAWQQRAQQRRAFARSPELFRFVDMQQLLFHVSQDSPGALDLLQQLLECEAHVSFTDHCTAAVLSLPRPHLQVNLPLKAPWQPGAATSSGRALQIEHAHSQLCCRPGSFHTLSRIVLLPAYLNAAKSGGRWVTLRHALVRWPSLVLPQLLRIPGWLLQHVAELDDWLVGIDGTLLTRKEWEGHPCAEAVFAKEYSQQFDAFLDAHGPQPPCPCECCRSTIQGLCERLRARWAHSFTVRLAEAVPESARVSDVASWGPQGAPVLLCEGSDVLLRIRTTPGSSRSRPSRAAALSRQAQQAQQAQHVQQAQQVQQEADREEQLEAAAHAAAIADAEAEEAADGQQRQAGQPSPHQCLGTLAAVLRFLAPEAAAIAADCGCPPGSVRHSHASLHILCMAFSSLLRLGDYNPAVLLERVLPLLRSGAAEAVAAHQPVVDAAAAAALAAAAEVEQAALVAAQWQLAQAQAAAHARRRRRTSSAFEVIAVGPSTERLRIKRHRFKQGLDKLKPGHLALLQKLFPDRFD
ncbi:hypothetical protein C2E21_4398 [Chlorella sorokiniana]|uniref:Uncharacterized protein n=1 Tax=Chlorella sorokiniana TaxID=3076 RepID=A0A2P6TTD9_CHLSO|nr:hypothetical protein C2E21_4398 [Chlorella sorokiniana]|eukprot:PRW57314.1 hypothetical protein C2E21_4398 [Chlorella sorokiniana]